MVKKILCFILIIVCIYGTYRWVCGKNVSYDGDGADAVKQQIDTATNEQQILRDEIGGKIKELQRSDADLRNTIQENKRIIRSCKQILERISKREQKEVK